MYRAGNTNLPVKHATQAERTIISVKKLTTNHKHIKSLTTETQGPVRNTQRQGVQQTTGLFKADQQTIKDIPAKQIPGPALATGLIPVLPGATPKGIHSHRTEAAEATQHLQGAVEATQLLQGAAEAIPLLQDRQGEASQPPVVPGAPSVLHPDLHHQVAEALEAVPVVEAGEAEDNFIIL